MTKQEIEEGTIQMRMGERKMLRENERWTEEDRKTLRREYQLGTPINEIALMLERSEGAIYQQIKQQGLCIQNYTSKKKSSKKKECLCKYCQCDCSLCPNRGACKESQEVL